MAATAALATPTCFQTSPSEYRHWTLSVDGDIATLLMHVQLEEGEGDHYELKLNSYDLGVDIELNDAIQRLRFEHPEVRTVVLTGGLDRVFCAGANIIMLRTSSHAFKVNFCKYTNETRLAIEDASQHSNKRFLAALNGTASGGGYELALLRSAIPGWSSAPISTQESLRGPERGPCGFSASICRNRDRGQVQFLPDPGDRELLSLDASTSSWSSLAL